VSIFDGSDDIVNRHLFAGSTDKFQQTGAFRRLCQQNQGCSHASAMLGELYEIVEDAWLASRRRFTKSASRENWRFTLNPNISDRNLSCEKQVEKRIAQLASDGRLDACGGQTRFLLHLA